MAERTLAPDRGAGRRVAEEIHVLLTAAGIPAGALERVVVGVGPGGFTGLRIGIATALAFGQALRIPVVGASTLEALAAGIAAGAPPDALVVPVIDARRREVFAGAYRAAPDGGLVEVAEPRAATADMLEALLAEIAGPDDPAWLAGDGLHRCAHLIGPSVRALPEGSPAHRVSAVRMAARADAGGALPVIPRYLRLPDAEVNRMRLAEEAATA